MSSAAPPVDLASLEAALHRHFGFSHFRPGQAEALSTLLGGQHALVVMPTGAGKSLIYQLAAVLRPGVTLVVSPLLALMKDQADSLARRGIPATYINSLIDYTEQRRRLAALRAGQYKIVLVAPERLRNPGFRATLKSLPIRLLVVDEAHCVTEWGHDFRPDYLHITDAWRELDSPLTLALTATATPRVQADIVRLLGLPNAQRLVTGFNRPNLLFEVFTTPSRTAKLELLRDFLTETEGAGIIYAGTRANAEEVAIFAREVMRLPAEHYHAGLDARRRAVLQDAFMAGDLPLIVATNAFGMGIDRPDVRFVLHYTLPSSLEAYYQEAGRAGRDGLPARACLLYAPDDRALQEWMIDSSAPTPADLRMVHAHLTRASDEGIELSTGLPRVKARVAFEELEAAGLVQRDINPMGGAGMTVGSLDDATVAMITDRIQARQAWRRRLLAKMVEYAETNSCRRRIILDYFGDTGPADAPLCCDNDLARRDAAAAGPATSDTERAALTVLDTVKVLRGSLGRDKLAKILAGSKASAVQRFQQHRAYGALSAWRRRDVAAIIDDLIKGGYLKAVGSELPTVALTAKGEVALQDRAAMSLGGASALKPSKPRADDGSTRTIDVTRDLLRDGLDPAAIADRRALTLGTVYSHLAQLIAEHAVALDAVVPASVQAEVRAAMSQVGDTRYLAPIKALLPDIDYGVIRCVVNADAPPKPAPAPDSPTASDPDLLHALKRWRRERAAADGMPAFVIFHDATLERIAATRPATPDALLAIHGIGPTKLARYGEEVLALVAQHPASPRNSVADFLARPHPRPLDGPWQAGWALDAHSHFDGDAHTRSGVGQLVYRYKYCDERGAAEPLADAWAQLLAEHGELLRPDAIVPVPPSSEHAFDPVATLATTLEQRLAVPVLRDALVKTRATRPQKEMKSLAQKRGNVAGAFALRSDVRGKRLLVIDDLYDSGATLEEVARVLGRGGPASIIVLTLTKTIHADA